MRPDLVRSAVERCLVARERREIDSRLARAYQGQADALLAEIEDLLTSAGLDRDSKQAANE